MAHLLHVFTSRRMAIVLILGFCSGIPLALTGSTLQAWMSSEKVDITVIGIFSLVGLPYTLKFFWAPAMDRFVPPFLGRRRGWLFVTQLALIAMISGMGFSDPVAAPGVMAALAVAVAFFSASQDIVVDAYRAEVLHQDEYGAGAGVHIMGYRLAMLVSGAFALILADHLPWKTLYLLMASTMLIGVLTSALFAPEPQVEGKPPRNLKEAVVLPLREFLSRRGAIEVLVFILLYKLDVVLTVALTTPFMLELGFTKTDIGAVTKGFGMISTIVGSLLGGAVLAKVGIKRSLWIFGLAQGVSGLSFMILAHVGHSYPAMVASIALENLCSGMGNAAFLAFLMSLCDQRFTATQYALLSSFMAITRVVAGAPAGFLVKAVGWETYYVISTLIMIPGLILLTRYDRWSKPSARSA